jgi:hypothetical protein
MYLGLGDNKFNGVRVVSSSDMRSLKIKNNEIKKKICEKKKKNVNSKNTEGTA